MDSSKRMLSVTLLAILLALIGLTVTLATYQTEQYWLYGCSVVSSVVCIVQIFRLTALPEDRPQRHRRGGVIVDMTLDREEFLKDQTAFRRRATDPPIASPDVVVLSEKRKMRLRRNEA